MIRITSKLNFVLKVPFLAPRGVVPKFFDVPAWEDGKPGVVELDELDNITIERLRWHYDWRPTDVANKGKKKEDLQSDQIAEIGLLKIEILDGKASAPADGKSKSKAA
jgi:hypothetical protein